MADSVTPYSGTPYYPVRPPRTPSARRHRPWRGYAFCFILAGLFFLASLHFALEVGAPRWISLIGLIEGTLLALVWNRWPRLLNFRDAPWYGKLLLGLLLYCLYVGLPRLLVYGVIPQAHYHFEFEAGFLLALASGFVIVFPLILADCEQLDTTSPE